MPLGQRKLIPGIDGFYLISLTLVAASLPLSKYTASMFQMSAFFFWLLYGVDFASIKAPHSISLPTRLIRIVSGFVKAAGKSLSAKMGIFMHNKAALVIVSVFALHLAGLLFTSDFAYAAKDLRTKLPILLIPIVVSSGPRISGVNFRRILGIYVAAVIAGCLYRTMLFMQLPVHNPSMVAAHTSHIRFSLNAVFAVGILLYYSFLDNSLSTGIRIMLLLMIAAISLFLGFMNYTTGLVMLLLLTLVFLGISLVRIKNLNLKIGAAVVALLLIGAPAAWIVNSSLRYLHREAVDFSELDKYTALGNSYYHDTVNFKMKHGKWTGLYICDKELRQEWPARSKLSLDSLDKKRQLLRYTLIRYLASKNLRKDAAGISQLSETDIRNIEAGESSAVPTRFASVSGQLEDFLASLQRYRNLHDPNSGSLVQRFEYWRTSLMIIRQHPLTGVGTGDVPMAFKQQYERMKSPLSERFRLRSHNQYLSMAIAFGIPGLLWFLFALFYPGVLKKGFNNYFYLVFWIILMVSMFTEDTIESQEGVTFFVFFTAFFLLSRTGFEENEKIIPDKPKPSQS